MGLLANFGRQCAGQLLVWVVLVAPAPLFADDGVSARTTPADPPKGRSLLEIGVAAGAFVPSSQHELYDSRVVSHAPFHRLGPDLSLNATWFPIEYLGIGLEAGVAPIGTSRQGWAGVIGVRGHAMFQLPWVVTPYVLAGGGALGVYSSQGILGADFDRALHWGAGAKMKVSEDVSITLGGRHLISAREGPAAGNTHHFEFLLGASFSVWRAKVAPRFEPIAELQSAEPEPAPAELIPAAAPTALAEPEEKDCRVAANNPDCMVEEVVRSELERVHFAWGKARLRLRDHEALNNAAELLLEHENLQVEIAGHTDSSGPKRFNVRLSKRRAVAVKNYLLKKGVEADRVMTFWYGPSRPAASNNSKAGRALNRRSDIRVFFRASEGVPGPAASR